MTPRRHACAGLALALSLWGAPATAQEVRPTKIADIDFGAGIAVHPDGRIFVSEREGTIRVVDEGGLRDRPLTSISTTIQGETGLLGLAVDPTGRHVYAFATSPDGGSNRVWRVDADGGRPEVVVDGLPAGVYHNGGGVAFDRSGMLLVSNGEQHSGDRAQDPNALGGKIYRFTPDGDVPADNPFGDSPAFAIGLRNPYGLTVDAASDAIYVTENGPESFDEIDRIERGANYGWPDISGPADGAGPSGPGRYVDPLVAYENIIVPTGIAVADRRSAAPEFRGDVFFGTYGEGTIHRLQLDDAGNVASDEVFIDVGDGVIGLAWGPEGLYYATTTALFLAPIGTTRSEPTRTPATTAPSRTTTPGSQNDDGLPTTALVIAALALTIAGAAAYRVSRKRGWPSP